MADLDPNSASRFSASLFCKHMIELINFAVYKYDLSIEELAIIALVFSESTRPMRENPELARQFGLESKGLPDELRPTVQLKFVHETLGLSRETARRKLERLVERGFLDRRENRYLFANPEPGNDFTRDLRLYLQSQLRAILSEADQLEKLAASVQ